MCLLFAALSCVAFYGWYWSDRATEEQYARYAESERKRYDLIRRFRHLDRTRLHDELDAFIDNMGVDEPVSKEG